MPDFAFFDFLEEDFFFPLPFFCFFFPDFFDFPFLDPAVETLVDFFFLFFLFFFPDFLDGFFLDPAEVAFFLFFFTPDFVLFFSVPSAALLTDFVSGDSSRPKPPLMFFDRLVLFFSLFYDINFLSLLSDGLAQCNTPMLFL